VGEVEQDVLERGDVAAEEDAVEEVLGVGEDAVLIILEPREATVLLRTDVERALQRGGAVGGEHRQIELHRSREPDVRVAGVRERREVNAAHRHAGRRLLRGVDAGEELVLRRGPDDVAGLLERGDRLAAGAHEGADAAALQLRSFREVGVVAVVGDDVQVLADVRGVDEAGCAEADRGLAERLRAGA